MGLAPALFSLAGGLAAFAGRASAQDGGSQACNFEVGAPVKTTSGTLYGHRSPNATQVSEYIGIPYAQPPVGNLRFAPPVKYTSDRNITASNFGHDCPSESSQVPGFLTESVYNILANLGQVGDDQQEDCLYINVWSKPQSGSARKPVLVWIYGGGFQSGGTNTTAYGGQFWAENEDVVFVNFNYRLNIFGFPGAPDLTQNVGLLDQRMAIEWVRDNIEAFGGDPNRIVIFGQSAGSASVDYYTYAYYEDPIINGYIMQSGTSNGFGNVKPESGVSHWFQAASKLGCGDANTGNDQVLSCMRTKSMMDILKAQSAGSGLASTLGNFGPVMDNKTVFFNYTDLALNKRFIQKPAIIGNNYYESGLFKLLAAGANIKEDQWIGFQNGEFTCPSSTAAEFRHAAGLPVWRYIWNGIFPNTQLPTSMDKAWHGSEILPMFGSSEGITKQDSTWQERSMGSYMRGAWAAFAACPESGLTRYGWMQYSNDTRSLLQLGFDDPDSLTYNVMPTYNTSMAYDSSCGPFPYGGNQNR